MRRVAASILLLVVASLLVGAKDQPFQVVSWPDSGQPVLRFTFSKFKDTRGGMGRGRTYISDVEALNLSDKIISGASFSLYVFDKGKARIGEGYINLTNVSAGETVKFQVTIAASGSPNSVAVSTSAPRTVSITVNSVPQGAVLTVDGKAAGTTPKLIDVAIGKHMLGFEKEGFNPGKFPLEITSHDTSGGSVRVGHHAFVRDHCAGAARPAIRVPRPISLEGSTCFRLQGFERYRLFSTIVKCSRRWPHR